MLIYTHLRQQNAANFLFKILLGKINWMLKLWSCSFLSETLINTLHYWLF